VEFFNSTELASKAGYRACKRCKPDENMHVTDVLVKRVRTYIEKNLDQPLTLDVIGRAVGISPFHLQRVFKGSTGMTPREYVDECRLTAVKKELKSGRDVTEALYTAGYGSSSRLYERSAEQLGMTPRAYAKRGKGELIHCAFVRSQFGLLLVAGTTRGLCYVQFGKSEKDLMTSLISEFSAATIVENAEELSVYIEALAAYLAGQQPNLALPVDMIGTTFQQAVWRYLRKIPAGQTRTYTEVAEALGQPAAVRAVASACAANKVALAIPCHRVLRKDGSLGGYPLWLDGLPWFCKGTILPELLSW